jgi:acyl-CoA thioesterase
MGSDSLSGDRSEIEEIAAASDASSFAQLMGMKIVEAGRGYALARMEISEEKHLNFNGLTHGAVIFAIADHACGLCGNSMGVKGVLVHASITFLANPKIGAVVTAEARMTHTEEDRGVLHIDVQTSEGERLAQFQATVLFLKPASPSPH